MNHDLKRAMGFAAAVVLALPTVWAQTTTLPERPESPMTIRLVCTTLYALDDNGRRLETTGEELVTITYSSDGIASIKRSQVKLVPPGITTGNTRAEFRGLVTEDEISGEMEWDLNTSATRVRETLHISRFTGESRRYLGFGKDGEALDGRTFVGNCMSAERKF